MDEKIQTIVNEMVADHCGTDPDLLDDVGGLITDVLAELIARGLIQVVE